MKPVRSSKHKHEEGCVKMSSSCVIWQGPDIPCINLCKGDAIDDVVYKLAVKLCEITENVLDITQLDFKCLVPGGSTEPESIIEAVQLIIDKQCFFEENCCNEGSSGGGSVQQPITLPACLYFTNEDGDEVTALLPAEYSRFLAEKICEIIDDVTSLQESLTSLNVRVTALENNTGGGGSTGNINVVSQCASAPTPGMVVPISQAFSAFEGKFCELTTLLGSTSALSSAIATECANLDNSAQLSNAEALMKELPGWVENPSNVSQTIKNMWLTICDMRAALQECCGGSTITGCVALPATNVQFTNLTSSGCTITWDHPNVGTNETPTGYLLQIFEWNGTSTVGPFITNVVKTYPTNSHVISTVPDASKNYIAYVTAQYSCDEAAPASRAGKMALTSVLYCVSVTDVSHDDITDTCDGSSYTVKRRKTTLSLVDINTGNPVVNAGAPFSVTINYDVTGDCGPSGGVLAVTKTFSTGLGSVDHIYANEKYVKCSPSDPCTVQVTMYSCIASITSERAIACSGEVEC